jgi:hypothetical protein
MGYLCDDMIDTTFCMSSVNYHDVQPNLQLQMRTVHRGYRIAKLMRAPLLTCSNDISLSNAMLVSDIDESRTRYYSNNSSSSNITSIIEFLKPRY